MIEIPISWVRRAALLLVAVFFLLLTFKLAQIGLVASWPWWAVFAPLWGQLALVVCVGVFALFMDMIVVPIRVSIRSWLHTRETLRRMDDDP